MEKHTFYLDMDGVVADWNAGVKDVLGYAKKDANAHYSNEDWDKIKQNARMYRDLPVMIDAEALVNLARQFRDKLGWNLAFLTAVPKGNDVHWAFYDKVLWAQKHFPDIPVHFGPYAKDKHIHCKPGDILVDDRHSNISEWKAAGGIGVEVDSDDLNDTIVRVRYLLYKYLDL